MKESRSTRVLRDRKAHLSPDAERLVTAALGLSNSGSRLEDQFWEAQLAERIGRMLDTGQVQAVHDALDRLQQTDIEANGALVEAVETAAESVRLDIDGVPHDALLVSAPVVAWTRFRIPDGALPAEAAERLATHWQAHVLAREARFRLLPFLYSLDQLPQDFADVRRLTKRLAQSLASGTAPRMDVRGLPESADMLADTRFLLAVVAVPVGQPLFRWQETDAKEHATRVQCLEQWVAQGRPGLEPLLPGCGFECLLPDAYHINLRESDRRVRPWAVKAAVHFLMHTCSVEPAGLRASIAAFGHEGIEEWRIGLSVGDQDEVAQGVVWPVFGAEAQDEDPSVLDQIKEALREAGVTDLRVWSDFSEPEFCEDCGTPLFPNPKGEVAHTEMPEDAEPQGTSFH